MLRQTTLPIKNYADPIDYSWLSMHSAWLGGRGRPSSIAELKELLMTLVVDRNLQSGGIKLHVLIVVVGGYDAGLEQLNNSHVLADDLIDMWGSGRAVPADGMELQTIDVLWSSPNSKSTKIELPTLQNCDQAFRQWADRIKADGGVGVLHWVGHGYTVMSEGNVSGVTLLCSDATPGPDEGSLIPTGHAWEKTTRFITSRTGGRPIFCFVDSCRKQKTDAFEYSGLGGPFKPMMNNSTQSYYSCSEDERAFWVQPHNGTNPPLFTGEAIGSRAFMAALTGFGAWINNLRASNFDTRPDEIVEAVDKLSEMWLDHYQVTEKVTAEWDGGSRYAKVTSTAKPQSVVRATSNRKTKPPATADSWRISDGIESESHCRIEPFWFTVNREEHRYRVDHPNGVWDRLEHFTQPSGDVVVKV